MPKYNNNKKFNFDLYDKKHLANLVLKAKYVQGLFDEAAKEAASIGEATGFNDPTSPFFFSDYPQAKQQIDAVIKQLHSGLLHNIESGDREEWLLACEKNDKMVDSIVGSSKLSKAQISAWKQPNLNALEAFQSRKIEGLNLSDKVWNITDQFKGELELALDIGLGEGKSAADLSRDVRKLLKEPNKLFRRVRDKHGNLRLSKSARNYHPGQGVYRSSARNAMRLTATENNIAYRTSDHERWQQIDFVIGIEINLSNNHTINGLPLYDICDELKGVYPKDFKFTGWHPFCRCFAVPKLADMKQFLKYQQALLAGEDVSEFKFSGEVKNVPDNFKKWLSNNEDRAKRFSSIPYFIRDNGNYVPKSWVNGIGSLAKKNDGVEIKEHLLKLKDPTFVTEKEVKTMLLDFAGANPQYFNGDLKGITISNTGSAFMSNGRNYLRSDGSYSIKDGNTLTIHNKDFILDGGVVFNPLHEVKEAMKAIASKQPLTFNQEYAIESLWHEIRHAGAVGWKDIHKKTPSLRDTMECVNQFCARRSYNNFLSAIGGKATHKKAIMSSGYGYSGMVKNFDKILKTYNISSSNAYAHLSKTIMSEAYEDIQKHTITFFVNNGVAKKTAENLIKGLPLSEKSFNALF